ncbi:alanine dehydrogenase [Candidatus Woesearchaeota archaeon]|nr:MAG: alanine dehydrogenase [Candidatus Woesearchaeota archaeon]
MNTTRKKPVVSCIKEIKNNENRVGLTPKGVQQLRKYATILIEKGAGKGSGFSDEDYEKAGATITTKTNCFKEADILVKVKEPLPSEYKYLKYLKGKKLYTYLHLAAVDKQLTKELLKHNITAIGYETIEHKGELVALKPMSEVAGILAIQYAAQFLQKKYGGRGVTLGQIDNVDPALVVIIGGGTVGRWAAKTAAGMGCKVVVIQRKGKTFNELHSFFKKSLGPLAEQVRIVESTPLRTASWTKRADVVIGSVLIRGAKAPKLVTKQMVEHMQEGSVLVDVAIDQGGCIWGSRPTTHDNPIYTYKKKIYCAVPNMPGQVPRQSTIALTQATLPYLLKMVKGTAYKDKGFMKGVQIANGFITHKEVAASLNMMDKYLYDY